MENQQREFQEGLDDQQSENNTVNFRQSTEESSNIKIDVNRQREEQEVGQGALLDSKLTPVVQLDTKISSLNKMVFKESKVRPYSPYQCVFFNKSGESISRSRESVQISEQVSEKPVTVDKYQLSNLRIVEVPKTDKNEEKTEDLTESSWAQSVCPDEDGGSIDIPGETVRKEVEQALLDIKSSPVVQLDTKISSLNKMVVKESKVRPYSPYQCVFFNKSGESISRSRESVQISEQVSEKPVTVVKYQLSNLQFVEVPKTDKNEEKTEDLTESSWEQSVCPDEDGGSIDIPGETVRKEVEQALLDIKSSPVVQLDTKISSMNKMVVKESKVGCYFPLQYVFSKKSEESISRFRESVQKSEQVSENPAMVDKYLFRNLQFAEVPKTDNCEDLTESSWEQSVCPGEDRGSIDIPGETVRKEVEQGALLDIKLSPVDQLDTECSSMNKIVVKESKVKHCFPLQYLLSNNSEECISQSSESVQIPEQASENLVTVDKYELADSELVENPKIDNFEEKTENLTESPWVQSMCSEEEGSCIDIPGETVGKEVPEIMEEDAESLSETGECPCNFLDFTKLSGFENSKILDIVQHAFTSYEALKSVLESAAIGVKHTPSSDKKVLPNCPPAMYYRLVATSLNLASASVKCLVSMNYMEIISIAKDRNLDVVNVLLPIYHDVMTVCQNLAAECQTIHINYLSFAVSQEGLEQPTIVHDEIMGQLQNTYQTFYDTIRTLQDEYEQILEAEDID